MIFNVVVDIEDEKESASGLVYILHTKRLARIVKENRLREEGGIEGDGEEEILQREEKERFSNNLKS